MNPEAALPTLRLDAGVSIAQAAPWTTSAVTLDSPATAVMTDLTRVKAATTLPTTTLRQAEKMMVYQGVRMLFVVSDMPSFDGLVTLADLHGDRQMQVVHDRQARYEEISVADVMTPVGSLDAIDFDTLARASVGNVVATLQHLGHNHLLVVETCGKGSPHRVRGVVSRTQVERQLGTAIEITPIAVSFAEIERALA